MRRALQLVIVLAVLVAALGLVRHLIWPPSPSPAPEGQPDQAAVPAPEPTETQPPGHVPSNVQVVVPPELAPPESLAAALGSTNFVPPPPLERIQWEQQIDDILLSEAESPHKGRQLLSLFPHLPPEAQVEAAPHLVNLTDDADFPGLGPLLTNASTPQAVLEVLVGDLLNRPNRIKLPLLLAIASVPDHPSAGEAKAVLETMLGQDHGQDWAAWEAAIQAWLKEHEE